MVTVSAASPLGTNCSVGLWSKAGLLCLLHPGPQQLLLNLSSLLVPTCSAQHGFFTCPGSPCLSEVMSGAFYVLILLGVELYGPLASVSHV